MFVQLHSSFLTLCSRRRRGPRAPSMAKPAARARWEFWFPFKKLKSPAFLWLEELFLWPLVLSVTWGSCCSWVSCSHSPAVRLQLLCGLVLTWSFRLWAHKLVTDKGACSLLSHSVVQPNLHFPEGGNVHGRSPLRGDGNVGVFVLLAQSNCWCRELSSERAPSQSNTWVGSGLLSSWGLALCLCVPVLSHKTLPRALRSNEQLIFVKSFEAEWC